MITALSVLKQYPKRPNAIAIATVLNESRGPKISNLDERHSLIFIYVTLRKINQNKNSTLAFAFLTLPIESTPSISRGKRNDAILP